MTTYLVQRSRLRVYLIRLKMNVTVWRTYWSSDILSDDEDVRMGGGELISATVRGYLGTHGSGRAMLRNEPAYISRHNPEN